MVKKKNNIDNKKEKSEEVKNVSKKEQIKNENKILRNLLIGIGVFILVIVLSVFILGSVRNFEYEGVEFNVVKFCDTKPCLITYQTSVPFMVEGNLVPYNFYLRNDPRDTEDIVFEGEKINILPTIVFSAQDEFNCDGEGIIAVANLANLYKIIGTDVIKNDSIKCAPFGNHMFLDIISGDKTRIEQTGPACYDIYINNCEILEGTERFMIETFIELNKLF